MQLSFLCLKIYFARILDVSLGTLRTNYTVHGKILTSGIVAFFEIFVWFIIVKEALNTTLTSPWIAISYSLGYATGTIIGTYLSNKYINTLITVEVITSKATKENIKKIRDEGYGVSIVNTTENFLENKVSSILFITLNSRYLNHLKNTIREIDNSAFIVVNESKIVQNGYIK